MTGVNVGSAFGVLDLNISGFRSKLGEARADMQGFTGQMEAAGSKMTSVGGSLTKSLTLPIVGLGTAAVLTGQRFETSMTGIQATTGMTADEIERLSKDFMDLSLAAENVGFSANEIAAAFEDIAVSTHTAEEATDLMRYSMILAGAAVNDLADTAYFLSSYLLKVGKDTSYLEQYINLFGQAIANTGISLNDMQNYMFRMTPAFNQFGASAETNIAIMSRLYQAGIRGANLYSGMGTIMMDFATNGDIVTASTERFGVAMYDANGALRSNEDVMFDLARAMAEYGDQIAVAQHITDNMNQTQQAAWFEFMRLADEIQNEVIPGFVEAGKAIDGTGVAFEMNAERTQTFASQISRLKNIVQVSLIEVFNILLPVLERVAGALQRLAGWFSNLNPEMQRMVVILAAVLAAIGPLLMIVGRLTTALSRVVPILSAVKLSLAGITAPIMLAIAAVGLLVAAFVTDFGGIRTKTVEILTAVGEFIQNTIERIRYIWDNNLYGIRETVMAVFEFIQTVITTVIGIVYGIIEAFVTTIYTMWQENFMGIRDIVEFVFNAIRITIETVLGVIRGIIEVVLGILTGDWERAFNGLGNIVSSVFNGIRDKFGALRDFITNWISNVARALFQGGKDMFTSLWDGLKDVWNRISGWLSSVADRIRNVFSSATSSGGGGGMAPVTGASAPIDFMGFSSDLAEVARFSDGFSTYPQGGRSSNRFLTSEQSTQPSTHPTSDMTVNIYSPVAVDPSQAAGIWRREQQVVNQGFY